MRQKKTSLVTGAAGFMGSHLAEQLIEMGQRIVVLDDLSGGFKENVNPECTFIQGSITDEKLLDRIFNEYNFNYVARRTELEFDEIYRNSKFILYKIPPGK